MMSEASPFCPTCGSYDVLVSKKKQKAFCEDCELVFESQPAIQSQRLFLSYGHDEHADLVFKIRSDLESRGHSVWIDTSSIKSGDDWRRTITDGIMSASGVLSFLSQHSVRNPGVCLDELKIALCVKGSYIKTVLLENEKEVSPPSSVSSVQWLDMSEWRGAYSQGGVIWESWYAQKFFELCQAIESVEAQNFSGEITQLRNFLHPSTSDTKEQYLLSREYIGREWLNHELEAWRCGDRTSKAFVLLGGPGLGKSCFSAHQLHYNQHVICGIFCEWDKKSFSDARSVFRNLAFKLATRLPDYRRLLLEKLEIAGDKLKDMTPAECFDYLLVQPLSELIDGGRERSLILIDGLDEASAGERNLLTEVLVNNMDRLPGWISLLLTSRPELNIRSLFSPLNPTYLEQGDERNLNDIYQYLAVTLKDQLAYISNRLVILQEIVETCGGSFLHAALFSESVKSGAVNLADTSNYPKGLEAFFYQNFKRKYPDSVSFRSYRATLELMLPVNGIPIKMISLVYGLSTYDINDFLNSMGSLIRVEKLSREGASGTLEFLIFFHKTLPDWLTNRDKAGFFYVDARAGASKLAAFSRNYLSEHGKCITYPSNVDNAAPQKNDLLNDYVRNSMSVFFAEAEMWDEFQDFLLEEDTPLLPYWRAIEKFPPSYDFSSITERLWSHPDRDIFFSELQRLGESLFLSSLIERFIALYGLRELDLTTFNLYVDIAHLSGDYNRAVDLSSEYLQHFTTDDILNNKSLLRLAIRKLHHSMFFLPISDLMTEALDLEKKMDPDKYPAEYNELLFLIGGNLGVLSGNFDFAWDWTVRSLEFARDHGFYDYESRSVRKYADILCLRGDIEAALEMVRSYMPVSGALGSRYQLYLLGTLSEIYRIKGKLDVALQCLTNLEELSLNRGIPGWTAHALLAKANLLLVAGHLDDATYCLVRSEKIYQKLEHKWGIVNSGIVRYRVHLASEVKESHAEAKEKLEDMLFLSQKLQYAYCVDVIEKLLREEQPDNFQLLFL